MPKPRIVYYVSKEDGLAGYELNGLIHVNAFPNKEANTVKSTINYLNHTIIHELTHWGSEQAHGKIHTDRKWTRFINKKLLNKKK